VAARVQHLEDDAVRNTNGCVIRVPTTDQSGVQHFEDNSELIGSGLHGGDAIAESSPSHRAGNPGKHGSGAIAGRAGVYGTSPGGEPWGPLPSTRVGNPVWHGSFTGTVAQSHGCGAIAESGAGVRGPSPGHIASLEHHERYDCPGSYDVRGNGCSHSFIDRSHQLGSARENIHDAHYHNDNDFRRVTTDPYDAQQLQSPSREQARSPGSRPSPVRDQSPDSRRSPTHYNTTNSPDRTNRTERWQEMLAGGNDSFHTEGPSSPERVSRDYTVRYTKRNADDYDQDPSWFLQQSRESAPDRTRMIHGRRASRTHDGQMRDDMRDLSTFRHDNAQRSSMPAR
jgi:hypothetical protein